MAGFFLTTAALRISLLWEKGPLAEFVHKIPTEECWVSPLSHAILNDEFLVHAGMSMNQVKIGRQAVEVNCRNMRQYPPQYPYPDADSIGIWQTIRSTNIVIPPYDDGVSRHPEQIVGPDELLVFASAAANLKPLLGPAPTDQETLEFLERFGVIFEPSSTWLSTP